MTNQENKEIIINSINQEKKILRRRIKSNKYHLSRVGYDKKGNINTIGSKINIIIDTYECKISKLTIAKFWLKKNYHD